MSDAWGPLMVAAQGGDGTAYRRLLDETRTWLERYYRRRLPAASLDDAIQDALLAIHAKRHTYDGARPFGPWLAAIARYKWIDRLRSATTHRTEMLPDGDIVPDAMITTDTGSAVISATVLGGLLATLKPAQAAVIRLVKLQGLSIDEAAALTGQSAALVKVNIHRGLGRLTRQVEGNGVDHDD